MSKQSPWLVDITLVIVIECQLKNWSLESWHKKLVFRPHLLYTKSQSENVSFFYSHQHVIYLLLSASISSFKSSILYYINYEMQS